MTVYINGRSHVGINGGKLVIKCVDGEEETVPIMQVNTLFISEYTQLTSQALTTLYSNGASVYWTNGAGKVICCVTGIDTNHAPRRILQYKAADDEMFCLDFSRMVVGNKVRAQIELLNRYGMDTKSLTDALDKVEQTCDLSVLRGIEGSTAKAYFDAIRTILGRYGFESRNRRPPKDPVNAAMSYAYSLLYDHITCELIGRGSDTAVGFFHSVHPGHHALSSDLMEEYRIKVCDRAVLQFFEENSGNEIDNTDHGVYLSDSGRKRMFGLFDEMLDMHTETAQGYADTYRSEIQQRIDLLLNKLKNVA